jgi:hypothetical protein
MLQPQPPIQHPPVLQNPFALAYPGGVRQQQPVIVSLPQAAENPHLRGRDRR